jgi:N-acetylglucosamine kinase-like BadF-type ATPase
VRVSVGEEAHDHRPQGLITIDRRPLIELPAILLPHAGAQTGAQATHVMGVDGGATKTQAAVLDLAAGEVHLGHGGPSNQDSVGVEAAGAALLQAAGEAIERAGISAERLDAAVLAIAGTDTESVARHVHQGAGKEWLIVNDVVGAWATATSGQPGVAVISGTGSNVFGVGPDGRTWRAGGWGHVLGDEGAGYWLGVRSITAALRDRDASGPSTALSDAALSFFGVQSLEALATLVYSKPLTKSEIAAFAIETASLAEQGDRVARELYELGASELGKQVAAVLGQTGLAGEFQVGLIGSAFKAGEVFVGPLRSAIRQLAPQASIDVVGMSPVGGALMLALRACGAEGAIGQDQIAALIDRS